MPDPVTPGSGGTTTTTTPPSGTGGGASWTGMFDPYAGTSQAGLDELVQVLRQQLAQGMSPDLSAVSSATIPNNRRPSGLPAGGMGGRGGGGGTRSTRTGRRTIGSILNDSARWNDNEIEALQRQLLNAGYFPESVYDGNQAVSWGVMDQATRNAFSLLLSDAVLGDRALDTIIEERTRTFARTGVLAGGGKTDRSGILGGGAVHEVNLSSPAGVRQLADDVAKSVLGRELSEEDREKYVPLIQGLERGQQMVGINARMAADRTVFDTQVAMADGAGGGGLINPVDGGTFTDTLGAPRDGGARTHKGTDIFAAKGTAVVAPVSGEIVKAGDDGGNGGLRIWIKGDDGRFHYLAHMDSIQVNGGRVQIGQQVGTVGDSGNARGGSPHLHYSINSTAGKEDAVVNPAQALAGQSGRRLQGGAKDASVASGGAAAAAAGGDVYLPNQVVSSEGVDVQAELEEKIRKENPLEADAHDLAGVYGQFRRILANPGAGL